MGALVAFRPVSVSSPCPAVPSGTRAAPSAPATAAGVAVRCRCIQGDTAAVEWLVDGVLQAGTAPTFLFKAPNSGGMQLAKGRARPQAQPGAFEDAKGVQFNYVWAGLP